MALIGNRSVLHKSPMMMLGGVANAGDRSNFSKHGMVRSSRLTYGKLAALPNGYGGKGWMLPVTAGSISSANAAVLSVSPAASGALGLPGEGAADFSINFADATGGLISSGTGTATLTFTADGTVLATRSGDGSAAFSITTNTPLLGALGWVTATGAFSVTATLTSYARGFMQGSTASGGVLTEASIIAAMNASPPAVNIKKVNDVDVTGNGQPGTEWGP
jgi:hypothetical protein